MQTRNIDVDGSVRGGQGIDDVDAITYLICNATIPRPLIASTVYARTAQHAAHGESHRYKEPDVSEVTGRCQ